LSTVDRSGRVVCVGHAALDSVYRIDAFPARPTKVTASRHDRSVGGMAANAACAIAALGGQVALWGPIGDDEIGRHIAAELQAAGVAAAREFIVPGARSSHSAIVVEGSGERLIVSYRGDTLEAPAALVAERVIDTDVVMIDVRWAAGARCMAERAKRLGIPIVLDAEMGNVELVRALVPQADYVIFSENGWLEWLGRPPDPTETGDALCGLVAAGARLAAVTLGERGVVYAAGGAPVSHLPAFPVTAVETLGAGDTFHGAFALALAEGMAIDAALRFAAAAAALRCTRSGGRAALPTRAEVNALLAG
jgi:sulfofructose kinase